MKLRSIGWKKALIAAGLATVVGLAWAQSATGPAGAPLWGDVDGDGQITLTDARDDLLVLVGAMKPSDIPRGGMPAAAATPSQILRGRYLVVSNGCSDCHNRGADNPSDPNWLAGYIQSATVNPQDQGVFDIGPFKTYAANLTPDPDTGLGNWTAQNIFDALRTGKDKDGQYLAPPMPWPAVRNFSDEDIWSIVAYLKSIKAVKNAVPESQGPTPFPNGHGDWSSSYQAVPPPFPPYPGTNEAQ